MSLLLASGALRSLTWVRSTLRSAPMPPAFWMPSSTAERVGSPVATAGTPDE